MCGLVTTYKTCTYRKQSAAITRILNSSLSQYRVIYLHKSTNKLKDIAVLCDYRLLDDGWLSLRLSIIFQAAYPYVRKTFLLSCRVESSDQFKMKSKTVVPTPFFC